MSSSISIIADEAIILGQAESVLDPHVSLKAGSVSAELAPLHGGRLSALRVSGPDGTQDLVPPLTPWTAPERSWPKEGAYPLFPYSNRIRNAVVRHGGRAFAIRPHPAAAPHSLHGPAHLKPWRVEEADQRHATLVLDYAPDADWPWAFQARQVFALSDDGLTVSLSIRNDANEPAPAGMGWHPYFICGRDAIFRHDAQRLWRIGADHVTDGMSAPYNGEIADNLYLSEWSRATLVHPDGSGVTIEADATLGHLVLHRPAVGDYACIEPVSHVADGFNLANDSVEGAGLRVLQPAETLAGTVRLTLIPSQTR